jgi:thiosulfate/3-mercaptopyruvate sulfurtransferase
MSFFKILFISLTGLFWIIPAQAIEITQPIVETNWLAKNKNNVVILDIREDVKSFSTKPVFAKSKKTGKKKLIKIAGHIPGAILVNYKNIRAAKTVNGRKLIKMLPARKDFEKLMQSSGVNKNSAVVIVSKGIDNGDMTMATRLYWSMKYYGHDNMAILNGGLAQWLLDKRAVTHKTRKVKKGNWIVTSERNEILASSEEVEAAIKAKTQLVDTRMLSLYLGTWRKKSYVFANGHIPGAKSYPNELLTSPMPAKFIKNTDSTLMFQQLGIKPDAKAITYCNSGHLASGSWFVLSELMGNKNVKLYDGSMHQWTVEKRDVVKFKME